MKASFKDWLMAEAKRKPKEPDWPDADYSSGYDSLRQMQASLSHRNLGLQLFVPKRRDPAKELELARNARYWAVRKEIDDEEKAKLKEEKPPVLSAFRESPVAGDNKPSGAFWTSTAIEEANGTYSSDWYQYVRDNFKTWQTDYGYLFAVKSSALIIPTSYLEDYYNWAERVGRTKEQREFYKNSYGSDRMRSNFPWDQLSRHFDGVHHFGHRSDEFTYGWDVESTAWFNTSVLEYKGAVRLWNGYHEDDE
jgi:hypothetical protein